MADDDDRTWLTELLGWLSAGVILALSMGYALHRLDRQISDLDMHGSREMRRTEDSLAELRREFDEHRRVQEERSQQTVVSRRWAVGTVIALAALLLGLYPVLFTERGR